MNKSKYGMMAAALIAVLAVATGCAKTETSVTNGLTTSIHINRAGGVADNNTGQNAQFESGGEVNKVLAPGDTSGKTILKSSADTYYLIKFYVGTNSGAEKRILGPLTKKKHNLVTITATNAATVTTTAVTAGEGPVSP